MDKNMYITVGIICSFLWMSASQHVCVYKECYCSQEMVLCENEHLQAIPELVNTSMPSNLFMLFDGNHIASIPAGSLPPNVESLNFLGNPIANIDDTAFDESSTTLNIIFLSNTVFSRFPNAFGHLKALQYLAVSSCNISDWNENVMKNISKNMQTLVLDTVGMTTWPTWIQYFSSLSSLTISGSTISSLPDDALDSLINNLSSLFLNNNQLTIVPKTLSKLINLQGLYLEENHIHDLSWLPHSSPLSTLSLSNNYISNATMLSESLRPFAKYLSAFDIEYNLLTSIPDFSYFTQFQDLNFTHNRISDPYSGSLPLHIYYVDFAYNLLQSAPKIFIQLLSITDISLSNNVLKAIQSTDFHPHTTSLDLGYNLISALTDSSFPENSAIEYLELNNNPLTHISAVALKNLPNLHNLNLKSTLLTRLPIELSLLTKLRAFDVSFSTQLVCTCMESSLTNWITKLKPENVNGDCGHVTVYTFFTELSPSCPT